VVGDELVAGVGDPRALGWVGRVAVRTRDEDGDPAVSVLALGVPGEDTASLRERWPVETGRRWDRGAAPGGNRLVVGLGHADAVAGVSLARSRLNLADIVDAATQASVPCFVVGPPPPVDSTLHGAVAELSHGWQDVAQRRGVPYVDCFTPLMGHEQWFADLEPPRVRGARDGLTGGGGAAVSTAPAQLPTVPGQVGYGLLAWLVLHGGWHRWVGLTPQE
jgi:lysophospholipase L1-like esterase